MEVEVGVTCASHATSQMRSEARRGLKTYTLLPVRLFSAIHPYLYTPGMKTCAGEKRVGTAVSYTSQSDFPIFPGRQCRFWRVLNTNIFRIGCLIMNTADGSSVHSTAIYSTAIKQSGVGQFRTTRCVQCGHSTMSDGGTV